MWVGSVHICAYICREACVRVWIHVGMRSPHFCLLKQGVSLKPEFTDCSWPSCPVCLEDTIFRMCAEVTGSCRTCLIYSSSGQGRWLVYRCVEGRALPRWQHLAKSKNTNTVSHLPSKLKKKYLKFYKDTCALLQSGLLHFTKWKTRKQALCYASDTKTAIFTLIWKA